MREARSAGTHACRVPTHRDALWRKRPDESGVPSGPGRLRVCATMLLSLGLLAQTPVKITVNTHWWWKRFRSRTRTASPSRVSQRKISW